MSSARTFQANIYQLPEGMRFMTSLETCPCFCRSKCLPRCRRFDRASPPGCYLQGTPGQAAPWLSLFLSPSVRSPRQSGRPSVGSGAKPIWLVPIFGNSPNTQQGRQPPQVVLQSCQCCPPPQLIDRTALHRCFAVVFNCKCISA